MPHHRKQTNFSYHPMFWLAAAFATGILAGHELSIGFRVPLIACTMFAVAAAVIRDRRSAVVLVLAAFAAAGAAAGQFEILGIGANRLRTMYDTGIVHTGDPVEVEGILTGAPEPASDGVFLNLRTEKLRYHGSDRNVTGNIRLYLLIMRETASHALDTADPPNDYETPEIDPAFNPSDLKYGSRLRIACSLSREDEFLNPGVQPKRELLDRLGIDATGSIKSRLLIEKIADESVFVPLAWVYDQRARLIDDFRANLSPRAAGIMIASLLGDKYFLDRETADVFRDGGTFHILIISGLHITFIGGLFLLFVRQFTGNRVIQFVIVVSALWAFTLAVGGDVPVVRAAIMFTVVLYSYVIYRPGTMLNSLGLCTLVLLAWRPSDLFNPSFQLTFVSVAAIVVMAFPLIEKMRQIGGWTPSAIDPFPPNVPVALKRFCEMLYWQPEVWAIGIRRQIWTARLFKHPYFQGRLTGTVRRLAAYLFEGLLVSLIVQIWMLPLMVVYFHRISIISILLNIWVGFFIAIESFAAVIGAFAGHFSGLLAAAFDAFAEAANWFLLSVPGLFSDNGWASFRLPAYSGAGRAIYFLYLMPVLFLAYSIYRWRPFELSERVSVLKVKQLCGTAAVLAVMMGIIVFHPYSAPRPDGRLHFDFLDVGQGDSALVTMPDGKTILVDGGGRFSYRSGGDDAEPFEPDVRGIGEAVVSEFLWYRGYSRIDLLIATHADADHIQGLTDVAKNFTIGSAAVGRTPMKDPDYAAFAAVLAKRGFPIETIGSGDRYDFGNVTIDVLYPVPTDDPDAVSDNDHSVVLRIVMDGRAFVMTGDAERRAESEIVASGAALKADLVKVGHHGSHTSSTQPFIDATGAAFAVISVGRTSPFGHPHQDVVARWLASNAVVMTTGEKGTISVSTDGKDLEITTFLPGEAHSALKIEDVGTAPAEP